jgi:hypothetical protein
MELTGKVNGSSTHPSGRHPVQRLAHRRHGDLGQHDRGTTLHCFGVAAHQPFSDPHYQHAVETQAA